MTAPLIAGIEGLTSAWLSQVLAYDVRIDDVTPVGTGQIGTCHRVSLTGPAEAPATVLVKLAATDPASRQLLAGAYAAEVRFYAELARTVDVRVPRCDLAVIDVSAGEFTLVLEDLAPCEQGDQLRGCTPAQAADAAANLAGLHGPRWCDDSLLSVEGLNISGPEDAQLLAELFGPTVDLFVDGLGDLVAAQDADTLRECVTVAESWTLARSERFGLVHGDYRLDNLMFPLEEAPGVVALDWQTLSLGLPARDLAYLVGTSLPPDVRRAHERDLVAAYHRALTTYDVGDYSFEACWDDYRFAMVQGPLVATFGCAYGTRTERGDRMFAAMVERSCAAIRDLDTIALAAR